MCVLVCWHMCVREIHWRNRSPPQTFLSMYRPGFYSCLCVNVYMCKTQIDSVLTNVCSRAHTHIVSIHTQLLYNAGKRCHSLKTEQQTTMVARNTVAQLPISMLFICNSSNHTQACILHFTHQNTLTHTDTHAPFFKHSHSVKKKPD